MLTEVSADDGSIVHPTTSSQTLTQSGNGLISSGSEEILDILRKMIIAKTMCNSMTNAWYTFEMRSSWINTAPWPLKSPNPTREVFSIPLFSITPASRDAPIHFFLLFQYFCNSLFEKKVKALKNIFLTLPKSCLERCSWAFLHQQKHHNILEFFACFLYFANDLEAQEYKSIWVELMCNEPNEQLLSTCVW